MEINIFCFSKFWQSETQLFENIFGKVIITTIFSLFSLQEFTSLIRTILTSPGLQNELPNVDRIREIETIDKKVQVAKKANRKNKNNMESRNISEMNSEEYDGD